MRKDSSKDVQNIIEGIIKDHLSAVDLQSYSPIVEEVDPVVSVTNSHKSKYWKNLKFLCFIKMKKKIKWRNAM